MARIDRPRRPDRSRIRVVSVIQSFRPYVGGAQIQLERLLPRLSAGGVEVTILTKRYPGEPRMESLPGGVLRRVGLAGASPLSSLAFVVACLAFIVRRRRSIDIVHAHGALSEGVVALGAARIDLPVLVRILRSGPVGDIERLRSKPAGRRRWLALARRAWFVALSAETRSELLDAGVVPDRIFTIPNGVDGDAFRPAAPGERSALRTQLGLGDGVVAVYAGRLFPEKRIDLAIDAVAAVGDLQLVVVGEGPERTTLERRVAALALAGRVRLPGESDRVADYLRAADLFLLPSRSEGMSNSLLEAMACGLACLASPVSGVPELLAEGRGVIVAGDDSGSWAAAIRSLIERPDTMAELGAHASSHVRASLTLDVAAVRIIAAYRAVLEARN